MFSTLNSLYIDQVVNRSIQFNKKWVKGSNGEE